MKEVRIEQFTVSGPSIRTNNASEFSGSGKITALWAQFYASQSTLPEIAYGVYSDYESDASGDFTVTAGTKAESVVDVGVSVKSGAYLVFPAEGEMPAAIIEAWKTVWEHFSKDQTYERSYVTDFEQYNGPTSAIVCIGVKASSYQSIQANAA